MTDTELKMVRMLGKVSMLPGSRPKGFRNSLISRSPDRVLPEGHAEYLRDIFFSYRNQIGVPAVIEVLLEDATRYKAGAKWWIENVGKINRKCGHYLKRADQLALDI